MAIKVFNLFFPCLHHIEFIVESLSLHEVAVRAFLCDDPVSYDADLVGVLYGGQAVGNDDTRATLSGFV